MPLFVALGLALAAVEASPADDSRAQCPNALASHDPPCAHGTMPASASSPHPENCASCAVEGDRERGCPSGWRGAACDVCSSRDACDKRDIGGVTRDASACTSKCWMPSEEELRPIGVARAGGEGEMVPGKLFSCACGGDAKTDTYCGYQANTTISMRVVSDGVFSTGKARYEIRAREYGGMPRQDQALDVPDKYKYAAAAVWDGNFTSCSLTVTSCLDPLAATETCAVYECDGGAVACPPSDVEPCPGRNLFGCGHIPGADYSEKYWQHPCNPLVTPGNRGMKFWCNVNGTRDDGSNVCYWTQSGVIPTLALTCHTGSCVYEMVDDGSGTSCPVHVDPPVYWTGDTITRAVMTLIVIVLVAAAWAYIRIEADMRYFDDDEPLVEDEDDVAGNALDAVRRFEATMQPRDGPSTILTWRNVSVDVRTKRMRKRILHDVSGMGGKVDAALGGMCAIMGPSGAGKTTLLDRLSGRLSSKVYTTHGNVYINGKLASCEDVRSISGYVIAEDVLPGTATVYEHLLFHAKLRLPASTSSKTIRKRVCATMQILGIEKLADSFIGDQFQRGLSGGEKRRVSIATELLMSPGIMFLDEPTTGLDSTNAAKVVDILSSLGTMGTTVLLSIHQPRPDIFRLLDRVLVLSGEGSVVYSGPSALASAHFASMPFVTLPLADLHIADYMLDVVLKSSRSDVRDMVRAFAESEIESMNKASHADICGQRGSVSPRLISIDGEEVEAERVKRAASFGTQVKLLCGRLLRQMYRHPFLIYVHFISSFIVALGVGGIFWHSGSNQGGIQNRMGSLFFILLFLTLMSLSSLPVWKEDRLLFKTERASRVYGADAYFTSMLLFDLLPMRVLPPFFFGFFSYGMIGLNEGGEWNLLTFVFVLILTNIVATCLCMAVGAANRNVSAANMVASLFFLVSILFGGFLVNKDHIPWYARWVAYLSFMSHGYEALVVNEFVSNPLTFTLTESWSNSTTGGGQKLPNQVPVPGEKVLFTFGFHPYLAPWDVGFLIAQGFLFAFGCYVFLKASSGDAELFDGDYEEGSHGTDERVVEVDDFADASDRFLHRSSASMTSDVVESDGMFASAHESDVAFLEQSLLNVEGADDEVEDPCILTWVDVVCTLRSGRRVLNNVSGIAGPVNAIGVPSDVELTSAEHAADLFAILGPSGAGKTTLLDILAGRATRTHSIRGDIRVNGQPIVSSQIRRLSGYVTQDDVLPGTATVHEHLLFHAKLRLPSGTSSEAIRKRVCATMQILGIEKLADSFIGDQFQRGLSGGEKRRVSIATELLMSPGIMFLDEPTTGLDSTNAAKVVDILSSLGTMGTTVLLSIHQPRPDIFRLLDRVLVLSGEGSVVYSGPSALASAHFASMPFVTLPLADLHIADYMLDVVLKSSRSDVRDMVRAFAESEIAENALLIADTLAIQYEDSDQPPIVVPKYVSPYVKQVRLLWQRLAQVTFRHPFLLMLHFLSTACASVALGLIFWNSRRDTSGIQNRMGVLFFIILYLTLMSLSSLPIWKEDQILFRRERASGVYGTNAYFTAVVLFDVIILRVIPPIFFAVVTYWMVGLHANIFNAVFCAVILIMTNVAASALCMCVGIISPSNASANVIGLLVLLVSILCGGFLLNKQDPHSGGSVAVTWLENLSFVNYAFEALLINEFLDAGTFYFTPKLVDSKPSDAPTDGSDPIKVPVSGKEVLDFFSFGDTRDVMMYDATALLTIVCTYLVFAFVLLKLSQREAMY
eukprot:CAMPEP_0179689398 /NCGR_PEP_ID=MMETSP0936-20121108/3175_1 /TAXON_ID=548131 ORGANISM="Ostreococcus mediterraneus, Strain clade-D-RCC2573" /NCGR_SAMPLE_ID=MMETSP0936 /ASSEMBLY_ACC=CAM_ASM_000574 /LENGTH=1734 /DNA_ID=CAMNT_0021562003 /DNA_START=11 /DNA_END=5218 /DNA_ORIENTATION=-